MIFVSLVHEDVYTTVQVLLSNIAHFNLTDLRIDLVLIDIVIVNQHFDNRLNAFTLQVLVVILRTVDVCITHE